MINISPATTKDISTIQSIANITWPKTFGPLMSEEQLSYMMEMMYSTPSLEQQINVEGHHYLLAHHKQKTVGYCSYELNFREDSQLMMHKLYLHPSAQGMGLGTQFLKHLEQIAQQNQQHSLRLQVLHTNENALSFYLKKGFKKTGEEYKELGNSMGRFLDYVLSKEVREVIS